MKIDIVTLFPKIIEGYFAESILGRASKEKTIELGVHDMREYTKDKHGRVDDTPYGGGAGMVIQIQPVESALDDLKMLDSHVIAMTAKGTRFTQKKAKELLKYNHLILLCGRYEGFDQRILDYLVDEQISIGNFVLTGGEIPAMAVVDATTRMIPGVLGNDESIESDSYFNDGQKQYPVYTKPKEYTFTNNHKAESPEILRSGNHALIEEWKRQNTK